MKGAYHRVVSGRRHEAGRQGRGLPSSRSQSGMRAGGEVRRDDRTTARGQAPECVFPPLSLPVRDVSRGRRPPRRRHDGTRPGAGVCFPPPLAPSQECEQGRMMAIPRRYDGDEQTRSTLGRADPEQGPP